MTHEPDDYDEHVECWQCGGDGGWALGLETLAGGAGKTGEVNYPCPPGDAP